VWLIARPGQALQPLAGQVRSAVGAAVERLLGLELEAVTVIVDGVENPRANGLDGARPWTSEGG
jgi:uncharacterized alkaline shock family protein YloU